MPISVSAETSSASPPHLWGIGNPSQWVEVAPPSVRPRAPRWTESFNPIEQGLPTLPLPSFAHEIARLLERLVELKIHVPRPNEVWQFLERYPHLISSTADLAEIASQRLPDAVLSLEISRDPEEGENYIVLYARFHRYDGAIINRIRVVREEFLSRLGSEREWPILTTDFRRP